MTWFPLMTRWVGSSLATSTAQSLVFTLLWTVLLLLTVDSFKQTDFPFLTNCWDTQQDVLVLTNWWNNTSILNDFSRISFQSIVTYICSAWSIEVCSLWQKKPFVVIIVLLLVKHWTAEKCIGFQNKISAEVKTNLKKKINKTSLKVLTWLTWNCGFSNWNVNGSSGVSFTIYLAA